MQKSLSSSLNLSSAIENTFPSIRFTVTLSSCTTCNSAVIFLPAVSVKTLASTASAPVEVS